MQQGKTRSALLWNAADIMARQGLGFLVTVVLARLVTPHEFGLIALMALFAGVASAFVDSGFSSALIQRQDVTHTDESTVFWFNLLMGAVVALVLVASGSWIAGFYGQPILEALSAWLGLNVFLSAAGAIQATLMTKSLNFRTQMKISVVATLGSGAVAIVMAMNGMGVWALAAQIVLATLITTLLLWGLSPWRPALVFSRESVRKLFSFGGYLMVAGLMDVIYTRLYSVLIGKLYSVSDLGFYNRADGARQLPLGVLGSMLSRVAFPVYSMASQDIAVLRRGVRFSVRTMMLVNVPLMLGMAAVSGPLIMAVFGPVWAPAVPLLQVMCLASVLWPLHVINLQALKAQGHSHLFFRLEVIKKVLGVMFLLVGTLFGVIGMVWSGALFSIVAFVINAWYTGKHLDYGAVSQTRDFLAVLGIGVPMAAIVGALEFWWTPSTPWLELLALVPLGIVLFAGPMWLLRLPHFQEALAALRPQAGPTSQG